MYITGEVVEWDKWLIIRHEKKIHFKKRYDIVPLVNDCVKIKYDKIKKYKSDDFIGKRVRVEVKQRENIFPTSSSVTLLASNIQITW